MQHGQQVIMTKRGLQSHGVVKSLDVRARQGELEVRARRPLQSDRQYLYGVEPFTGEQQPTLLSLPASAISTLPATIATVRLFLMFASRTQSSNRILFCSPKCRRTAREAWTHVARPT